MTAETLRDIVCPRGSAAEGADARSRTVRPDSGDHRPVAGGASRPEVGDWRGAYRSRSCGGPALALSGMRRHVRVARPSTGAAVAAPGHVPVQDDPSPRPSTEQLPGARGARGEAAVGGAGGALHGAVRG